LRDELPNLERLFLAERQAYAQLRSSLKTEFDAVVIKSFDVAVAPYMRRLYYPTRPALCRATFYHERKLHARVHAAQFFFENGLQGNTDISQNCYAASVA
jgi:hypothetical protein